MGLGGGVGGGTLDHGFLLLTAAVGLLLVCSTVFALLAFFLRLRNDRLARRRERLRRRWEPAILEILGGTASPEDIFDRVGDGDGLDFLEFLLGYARLLRGEERALVREMAAPWLPLLVPKLRGGTAESRGHAVLILARMGMPEYADAVARALRDESPVVAMIAARSIFRPGHEEHFPAVLEHLPRFTGWSRSFLASLLAGGGPDAAPHLRAILENPRERPLVRAVAADALRGLNDLESVPVALRLLSGFERDRELVVACLRLLERLGHHEHLRVVRPLVDSGDPVVRAASVSAVGSLGARSEVAILQSKLDDDSFWVSLEAARGLRALGEAATLERVAAAGGPSATLARQVLTE